MHKGLRTKIKRESVFFFSKCFHRDQERCDSINRSVDEGATSTEIHTVGVFCLEINSLLNQVLCMKTLYGLMGDNLLQEQKVHK